MAVEQLSSRTVQAISATAVTDAMSQLREGAILEGRVVAINPDDTLKLATRLGQLDIAPSLVSVAGGHGGRAHPTLSDSLIGTTVKFEVAAQTSGSSRLIVRLLTGDEAAPLATAHTPDTPDATTASLSARIAAEISQAAARQDGLAPVFSTAAALQGQGATLPDDLSQALANLAGFAVTAQDLAMPQAVRSAFLKSGLFLESKLALLANGEPLAAALDPAHPLSQQDLKAALLSLKPALDDWLAKQQPAASEDGASAASPARPNATALANATLNEASLAGVADSPLDTEALFAVLRPPPVASAQTTDPGRGLAGAALPAQAQPGAATVLSAINDAGTLAQLGALMDATGLGAPSGRRGPYGGRPLSASYTMRVGEDAPVATGRPPPPRRGSLPLGQAAVSVTGRNARDPIGLARALSSQVSNAIARISLGQYASLPETTLGVAPADALPRLDAGSWLFEIPVALPQGISIAQFEIDQVHDGSGGGEAVGPAWRVQFSIDADDLGPVHARLVLGGKQISVGLWAEAASGVATISALLPLMRRRLEDTGLTVAEIHFAAGRPPSGPPVRAGGFIDRNA